MRRCLCAGDAARAFIRPVGRLKALFMMVDIFPSLTTIAAVHTMIVE